MSNQADASTVRPAGWYTVGSGWVAYWDGAGWTGDRVRPEQLRPPAAPPPPAPAHSGPPPQRTWAIVGIIGLVALAGMVIAGVLQDQGLIDKPTPTKGPFAEAVERYQRDQPSVVERCCSVLTITLGRPDDPITAQRRREFGRLLSDLGFTDGVVARMEGTRALDGTQTAEGAHAWVTWTYHPDNGLRMVFEPT